ncbi:MAG: nicotinate-nucleotide adenylyltransferase [Actinomycetota bacterium]|nr:nicotinate-nucleotide adenylyltransferase [Actinomycetota bacterium]
MSGGGRRRVGVLGGTFDPVHVGHLVTAVEVRSVLDLDVVLLVVANEPWQKAGGDRALTPALDRLAVVSAAVSGVEGVEASSVEIDRGGPTYTADTLATLSASGDELFLIVGSDLDLGTWMRVDEVQAAVAGLVVVPRPGFAGIPLDGGWPSVVTVDVPRLEVSSTDLRRRVAEGRPIDFLVPEAAIHEIARRGLYARAQK